MNLLWNRVRRTIPKLTGLFILYAFGGTKYARHLGIKVGDDCRILTTRFGTEPFLIEIGNRVTVASGTLFLTHDGSTWLMRDEKGRRYLYRRIRVGNEVFIGSNCIIMPGVEIGNRVIVGAGAVVTKSVPDGLIVAGNPARPIGRYEDYRRRALDSFVSDSEMLSNVSYRKRIDSALDTSMRDPIQLSSQESSK